MRRGSTSGQRGDTVNVLGGFFFALANVLAGVGLTKAMATVIRTLAGQER